MRKLIAAIAWLAAAPACIAALTPAEESLAHQVQQSRQAQLNFLKRITNIQSGTLNIKGVRRVGAVVQNELKQMGFAVKWVNEPAAFNRAGTLIATHTGKSPQHILLIAHLDTVFTSKVPFRQYTQKKHSAKGQGVIDDKGGIAVILYALKALHAAHDLKDANIIFVLTGDEEDSGKPASISRQPLLAAAKKSSIALDFEPAITLNTATIARRGITMWQITTHGNASHSATIFQKNVGMGAIFGLAHQLDEIRIQLQSVADLTFNPGLILGGSTVKYEPKMAGGEATGKANIVAAKAYARGDLRYLNAEQKQLAEDKMRAILAAPLSGVKSEIEFVDGIPPMSATENNMKLLNQYSDVSMDLGMGKVTALPAGLRGAGDISYVAEVVPENLSGLGPVGLGPHTVIESIELESLSIQTKRAAVLLSRLIKKSV